MKLRLGFVSNSSSSSYVCDICGEDASGMDMTLEDARMYQCENGHTFCESHGDISEVDFVQSYLERQIDKYKQQDSDWAKEYAQEKQKMLEELLDTDEEDREEWVWENAEDEFSEGRYEMPSNLCPCCTFKSVAESDMLTFVLWLSSLTKKDATSLMRSKFESYKEFKETCGEDKK